MRGRLIEMIMCDFRINAAEILRDHAITREALFAMFKEINDRFENLLEITEDGLFIPRKARPLTRMIARGFDAYDLSKAGHSSAI
jgi:oxygen-independent coproporphyrinogen-3 oxidase